MVLLLLFFSVSVVLFSTLSSSVNKTTSSKAADVELNDIGSGNNSLTAHLSDGVKNPDEGVNPCENGIKQTILLPDPKYLGSPASITTDTDYAGSNIDGLAIFGKFRRVISVLSRGSLISHPGRWSGGTMTEYDGGIGFDGLTQTGFSPKGNSSYVPEMFCIWYEDGDYYLYISQRTADFLAKSQKLDQIKPAVDGVNFVIEKMRDLGQSYGFNK